LASSEPRLVDAADRAVRIGALVYLEARRRETLPFPWAMTRSTKAHRGFQGSPAIGLFYDRLVSIRNPRHWRYDDNAAVAVSTATLSWRLTLPCEAWDTMPCTDGQVQVRVGGEDAVHLDEAGCGAVRFALGLEERALNTASRPTAAPPTATFVADTCPNMAAVG
jgi:hypothetical protein